VTGFKVIGIIAVALVLFAIMAILVPALMSAKSTIAVIAGILIIVAFIGGAIWFAVKQISQFINNEGN
jgi:predicted PurR-regulated permease PerM